MHALPQGCFECAFAQVLGAVEHDRKTAEQRRVGAVVGGEMEQPVMDAQVIPVAVDPVAAQHFKRPPGERRLGADAGKVRLGDMTVQQRLESLLGGVQPMKKGS